MSRNKEVFSYYLFPIPYSPNNMVIIVKALQLILALSLLVLLHEGGHFFFSKLFGVRVNKFYIFFDWKFSIFSSYSNWFRKLRGKQPAEKNEDGSYKYDGTEYGIGWIPLGGYCQIEGMIDETQHDVEKLQAPAQPWEFRSKPAWQRLLIMIGGVLVNFILALFIYSMVLFAWGDDYISTKDMTHGMKFNQQAVEMGFKDGDILIGTEKGDFKTFDDALYRQLSRANECRIIRDGQPQTIALPGEIDMLQMMKATPMFVRPLIPSEVNTVLKDGAAAKAGLRDGDKILAFAGNDVTSWNEITEQLGRFVDEMTTAKTPADSMKIRQQSIVVMHKDGAVDSTQITLSPDLALNVEYSNIGSLYKTTHKDYGFLESFPAGTEYGWKKLAGYVSDIQYVFTSDGAKSLGGFGAIGNMFPSVWDWHAFWLMTAFLSIILAFMNILPIPALDGGHVLFLLYEMITRRKPSDKFMIYAEYVGFGILLLLMVVANMNDILRWVGLM